MFGSGMANPGFFQPYMASNLGTMGANTIGRGALSGLGKGLFSKFSFTGLLNGASKTLNVVNQAIPIFYQVKPMVSNAKTMFKIMGAVKDDNTTANRNIKRNNNIIRNNNVKNSQPVNNVKEINYIDKNEFKEENPVFFI